MFYKVSTQTENTPSEETGSLCRVKRKEGRALAAHAENRHSPGVKDVAPALFGRDGGQLRCEQRSDSFGAHFVSEASSPAPSVVERGHTSAMKFKGSHLITSYH